MSATRGSEGPFQAARRPFEGMVAMLRKDLRRFAPIFVGVLVGLAWWRLRGVSPEALMNRRFPDMRIVYPLIWAVVGLVVLEDAPVADRAFWRTRPLGPLATFLAKSILLLTFLVVLPATVQTEWMAASWPTAWRDFWLGSMLSQAMLVGLAMWVASVSRSWAHFLAAGAALFVGHLVVGQLHLVQLDATQPVAPSLAMGRSLGWALMGVTLAGWQYVAPRPFLGGVVGSVLLVTLPFAVFGSREPFEEFVPDRPERIHEFSKADSVVAALVGVALQTQANIGPTDGAGPALVGQLAIDTPGNTVAVIREATVRLQPGGRRHPLRPSVPLVAQFSFFRDEEFEGYAWLTPEAPPPSGWNSGYEFGLLEGSRDQLEAMFQDSDGIEVEFELDIYEPTLLARTPLRPGARLQTAEGTLEVLAIEQSSADVVLSTLSHGTARDIYWHELGPPLLLINEIDGRFAASSGGMLNYTAGGGALVQSPEWVGGPGWRRFEVPPGGFTEGWLDSAELAALGMNYVGSTRRTLRYEIPVWPELDGSGVAVDSTAVPLSGGPDRERGRP